MPTANLRIDDSDKLIPLEGIYAVRTSHGRGVMHIGPRPTFAGALPSLEVHIMDFDGDLYGRTLEVEFFARLRGIERFASPNDLALAMRADADAATGYFDRLGRPAGSSTE
jgi:riboflavin kinase/FMN adenylyltransferase